MVEDDAPLARTLSEVAADYASDVVCAGTVAEACQLIADQMPDIIALDFSLPDGTGLDVLEFLHGKEPTPAVVAITGEASPHQSFRLGRAGVRTFLSKPCSLADVRHAIHDALLHIPEPAQKAREAVGKTPIVDVESQVRKAMVSEAMAQAKGSISKAASLLGISRQRLQYILKVQVG